MLHSQNISEDKAVQENCLLLQPYSLIFFSYLLQYNHSWCAVTFHCRESPVIKLHCYLKVYQKWPFKYYKVYLQKTPSHCRCLNFFVLLTVIFHIKNCFVSGCMQCFPISFLLLLSTSVVLLQRTGGKRLPKAKLSWSFSTAEFFLYRQGGVGNKSLNIQFNFSAALSSSPLSTQWLLPLCHYSQIKQIYAPSSIWDWWRTMGPLGHDRGGCSTWSCKYCSSSVKTGVTEEKTWIH